MSKLRSSSVKWIINFIIQKLKNMLIILVLILLLIWSAVVWTIYSNFLVFYSNFSESENYHKAYYASISALERWELVVKQHKPWYMGSGGFILWVWTWSIYRDLFNNPIDNWWSDGSLSWFSYFEKNQNKSFPNSNKSSFV